MKISMKSKVVSGVLAGALLLTAFGINSAIGVDGPQTKNLSLEQAVELAVNNNPDMEVAKLNVEKATIKLEGAQKAAKNVKDNEDKVGTIYQNSLVKDYYPKASEVSLEIEKKKCALTESTLRFNVEKAYYDLLKAQKDLAIKKDTLSNAQEQLKIAQTGLSVGTRAKVDVIAVESSVAGAQASVTSAENTYKTKAMELNRITGQDLDTPLVLASNFTVQKIGATIDLKKTLDEVMNDNLEVYSVKQNLDLMKLQLAVAKANYGAGATAYDAQSFTVDTKIAEANIRKQEELTTTNVRQSYLTLFTLEKMLDYQTKEVEKAEENRRVVMVKFQSGLATSLDVKNVNLGLETSKESLAGTTYDYNLLKSQFKYKLFYSGAN